MYNSKNNNNNNVWAFAKRLWIFAAIVALSTIFVVRTNRSLQTATAPEPEHNSLRKSTSLSVAVAVAPTVSVFAEHINGDYSWSVDSSPDYTSDSDNEETDTADNNNDSSEPENGNHGREMLEQTMTGPPSKSTVEALVR